MDENQLKTALRERIQQLRKAEQEQLVELSMVSGALRESEYWLERLNSGEGQTSPESALQLEDIMPGAKFEVDPLAVAQYDYKVRHTNGS